ncbi:prepilin-type N-terminal cleavage/methylation domain-containing protein [Paenibacillus cremeus]|uniref:Prepilin-type N-terminal cleavage/methylation domain-containing protein n=1 Tax=Paenibacillus cremeus TaxID=2163881 RepID=A0A559KE67_9BACL|nr:prepilin-type N-terminal cleavage/methylation domain-containing protein [Paenibacillus cremeus]TVY10411.1 prepilin-type N-terminal cleavage/methylation domain-containing protein [Paenibacillus cremeus]
MSQRLAVQQGYGFEAIHNPLENQTMRKGGIEMEMTAKKRFVGFRAPKMSLREMMKNEKGLTLIELLAVIVIIAIIAAIAIPSIGSILEKTRVNAHRSNAHMAIDAARLYVSNEGVTLAGTGTTLDITLTDLNAKGYMEVIPKDPSNKAQTYDPGTASATATTPATTYSGAGSYVHIAKDATTNNFIYSVTLVGQGTTAQKYADHTLEANIGTDGYIVETGTATAPTP